MLNALTIENIKAFDGEHRVPLAPLTLLYGQNSSGKSSVLQSLLLLAQTAARAERRVAVRSVTKGSWADLGTEVALVNRHDTAKTIGVGIEWTDTDTLPAWIGGRPSIHCRFRWSHPQNIPMHWSTRVKLGAQTLDFVRRTPPSKNRRSGSDDYFALARQAGFTEFARRALAERGHEGQHAEAILHMLDADAIRPTFESWGLIPGPIARLVYASGVSGEDGNADFWLGIDEGWRSVVDASALRLGSLPDTLSYVGPLRHAPQRFVIAKGDGGGDVGVTGDLATERLAESPQLLERVNEWLLRLALPYRVAVEHVGSPSTEATIGDLLALVLTDARSGVRVAANDVGFGVSQLLPIVVQCVMSEQKVLLIEQPEIHVHPRLQSEVADLFAYAVSDRGNQVLVETHSEHLLLRLQRRLRNSQSSLSSAQIGVLYVDSLEDGRAAIADIGLDDTGEFRTEWPEGFFEERFNEMFATDASPRRG